MKVLLVEPQYRRAARSFLTRRTNESSNTSSENNGLDDESLWYPPLGLLKLARFHKIRGDDVYFVSGCDSSLFSEPTLFSDARLWDRVYITTLFTYSFKEIINTILFYKDAVGGTISKLYVGGIMASLMPEAIFEKTGVYPIEGIITSPQQIKLKGKTNIDMLPPLYDVLDKRLYAINQTFYAYTTRGCTNHCKWCGVPKIEPDYVDYIDIKPMIRRLRDDYGDLPRLKLMDNNILASSKLNDIVEDLLELGYGLDCFSRTFTRSHRIVDFNQGLDATHCTEANMKLLGQLNIKPMRIAFDRVCEKNTYVRAIRNSHKHGFTKFSNYMLYNFTDTPRDLYKRLVVNMEINEEWISNDGKRRLGEIYSFPMRYAPISERDGPGVSEKRDRILKSKKKGRNWLADPSWTRRFIRNVEIIKGAAHGAIPPRPGLARRAVGATFEEFLTNLYMPEELLRNRNKHEKKVYKFEPNRPPGTGKIEEFRKFILKLLQKQNKSFYDFHNAVSPNKLASIREGIESTNDEEVKKWLRLYLR